MLVLTGNVGNSVVLQSLVETHKDIYALVYDESPLPVETLFVCSKDFNIEKLCNGLRRDICDKDIYRELIVVYTNLREADTFAIKDLVKELEQDEYCRYGIVMCKE